MSNVAVAWRKRLRDSTLPSTTKLVGLVLSSYMSKEGGAFPSRTTIAAGASLKARAVDKAVTTLEVGGWLVVIRTEGLSNRYQATLPPVSSKTPLPVSSGTRVPASFTTPTSVVSRHEPVSSNSTLRGLREKQENGGLRKRQTQKLIEDCTSCGERGPVTDTGFHLLCDTCLPVLEPAWQT